MWPDLFGPGWQWMVLGAFGLGTLMMLPIAVAMGTRQRAAHDAALRPELVIWHRYEQGDLTRKEFERLLARVRVDGTDPREHPAAALIPVQET